ncbi:N-acetylglutamate synthase, CG3035 family [Corynebacterium glaucum]|uniref:N-acetylglutamate synthase, CG3035 family n=1 Tax=Corynebacterium glaucum TaxID=187491 RepID=UPI00265B4E10|nr:GNAT family N-acetyltransferase [Corynebacterium glaucum]
MSRIFRSDPVSVGDRVVVRRVRGELASDVIGIVESVSPLLVRRGDELVDIGEYHVMKRLSPRTVRNSDIRAIEAATARAFPGQEQLLIDGWLLRAGAEIAERSNSATPIGHSAGFGVVPLDAIEAFYREHDMPVQLLVPERIGKPALRLIEAAPERWELGEEIVVMSAELGEMGAGESGGAGGGVPDPGVRVDTEPDADWLAMYHYRGQALPEGAVRDLAQRIDGQIGFARLTLDGRTVAVTRATITASDDGRNWLGYSAVEVAAEYRRQGLGTRLGKAVLAWGAQQGADSAYLQVRASNAAGIGLYEKLGFVEHHRHRYARLR